MRVLVTGATGFVGAWTARAVAEAGHELRVLVRSPDKLRTTLGALGVTADEVVRGDMTDVRATTDALAGVDAVVHAAAVVSLRRRDAAAMHEVNLRGAQLVVEAAVAAGVAAVVHVSSVAALMGPGVTRVTAASPVGTAGSGYARSKAAVESLVRRLQEDGAPLSITYPGGVCGPPAGSALGESTEGVATQLRFGVLPCADARYSLLDVRDLARVHVALLSPRDGLRRYPCGGQQLPVRVLARELSAVTGRRITAVPFPAAALRVTGRALDPLPVRTPLTAESMEVFTRMPAFDDAPVHEQLGIHWRPARETLTDTVRGLAAGGFVSRRLAGRLAG